MRERKEPAAAAVKDRSRGARFVDAKCSACGWTGKLRLRGVDVCPRCGEDLEAHNVHPAVFRGTSAPFSWRLLAMMVLTGLIVLGGLLGTIALLLSAGVLPAVGALVASIAATVLSLASYRRVTGWPWQAAWRGQTEVDPMLAQTINQSD